MTRIIFTHWKSSGLVQREEGQASQRGRRLPDVFSREALPLVAYYLSLLLHLALSLTLSLLDIWTSLDLATQALLFFFPLVWPPCLRLWQFRNSNYALASGSPERGGSGWECLECKIWGDMAVLSISLWLQ